MARRGPNVNQRSPGKSVDGGCQLLPASFFDDRSYGLARTRNPDGATHRQNAKLRQIRLALIGLVGCDATQQERVRFYNEDGIHQFSQGHYPRGCR